MFPLIDAELKGTKKITKSNCSKLCLSHLFHLKHEVFRPAHLTLRSLYSAPKHLCKHYSIYCSDNKNKTLDLLTATSEILLRATVSAGPSSHLIRVKIYICSTFETALTAFQTASTESSPPSSNQWQSCPRPQPTPPKIRNWGHEHQLWPQSQISNLPPAPEQSKHCCSQKCLPAHPPRQQPAEGDSWASEEGSTVYSTSKNKKKPTKNNEGRRWLWRISLSQHHF